MNSLGTRLSQYWLGQYCIMAKSVLVRSVLHHG